MIKRVYIEITNVCNLRCSFCDFHHREKKEMSLDEFEYVIQQVKPLTSFIYLHVQGEPLCHSKFEQILQICDKYDMKVQLVSNGFLLPFFDFHHSCIRKVSISIHSIDEQKMDWKLYMNQIQNFIDIYSSNFYIDLRFWVQDQCKQKTKCCLEYLQSQYEFQAMKQKNSYKIKDNVFVSFATSFEWPNQANNDKKHGTCLGAKSMCAILSNGQVSICCLDGHGKINLGNVFDNSLQSILESKRYQTIIQGFNQNKCVEVLCQNCTYRNRF